MPTTKHKPQPKDTPVRDSGLVFGRFFSTVFAGRCPVCAQGHIAKSYFQNKDACEVCGARFERDSGNWLVSAVLCYFITIVFCLGLGITLVLRYGFFPGLTPLMVGVAFAVILLIFRSMKSLAVWLLWVFGFVYPGKNS